MAIQDEALIKAACIDPTVLRPYLAHIRSIYRYIYSKVGEVRQIDDLTSQVLDVLKVCHATIMMTFSAWLFSIARHKVVDYFRSQRPEVPIEATDWELSGQGDTLSTLIQTEEAQCISKLIHQLDEQDQELLRLRFVAGLEYGEIAQLINSNMEATKKRIYRLLANLRQQLESHHD
jgi:RNA polymerase sigma-70 factor (ECF subfamily)